MRDNLVQALVKMQQAKHDMVLSVMILERDEHIFAPTIKRLMFQIEEMGFLIATLEALLAEIDFGIRE